MKKILITLLAVATICLQSYAQTRVTEHIFSSDSTFISPKANLTNVVWLTGTWRGEAFGGQVEEIWSEPMGGSMMASFKLVSDGHVKFYELEIIREIKETLILQLKHFNGDLKGWEEKDITIDFPLIKVESDAIYFNGMTFEKVSEKRINVFVLHEKEDGTFSEWLFEYSN